MPAAPGAGPEEDDGLSRSSFYWMRKGMAGIGSPPALILTSAFFGFAGLARDAGLTWLQASFMTFTVWALPAKIVLVGAITAGLSLPAAALAVTLSSLRLMPMVVAIMPELRGRSTRTLPLILMSHFVAITAWVFAMERLSGVPRDKRFLFFGSFAVTLTVLNTLLVALVFNLMGGLPALATGALAFLTPVYFLASIYGSARERAGRLALLAGIVCLPPAHWLAPDLDLLVAGVGGGVAAFLLARLPRRERLA